MVKSQVTTPKTRTTKKTTTTRKATVKKKVDIINQESPSSEIPKTIESFNAMIDERIYGGEDLGLDEIEQARRRFFRE